MKKISTKKLLAIPLPCFKAAAFIYFTFISQISHGQQIAASYPSKFFRFTINYYEYLPPSYSNSSNSFPLLIFLHGTGEAGTVLSKTLVPGVPPKLIADGQTDGLNNFIVLSPQSPRTYWYPSFIDEFIEMAKTKYRIDISRIYVTGLSAGGRGTWDYAIAYPDKVAAILPIAAVTVNSNVCNAKNVPVWSFQGENDGKSATYWNTAYNKCNPPIPGKLTVITGAGHNTSLWGTVYQNLPLSPSNDSTGLYQNAVYDWLLSYSTDHTTPNIYPLAFAGEDILTELPVDKIVLTGVASDEDGIIEQYSWTQIAGPNLITLSNGNDITTNAYGFIEGEYTFEFRAIDNEGASSSDHIKVFVNKPITEASILYRINCGGSEIQDSILNWSLDKQLTPSEYLEASTATLTTGSDYWKGLNNSDAPNNVFGNNRYCFQNNTTMQWSFPVIPGQYILKLYFSDAGKKDGTRLINVQSEGNEILHEFDIHKTFGEAGGQQNFAIDVNDESLDLSLSATLGSAKIDGIEISQSGSAALRTEALTNTLSQFYFKHYPEPVEESLTIEFNLPDEDIATIELLDQKGIPIKTLFKGTSNASQSVSVNLADEGLSSGLYFITFRSNGHNITEKIMIRK
ncbi:MAG: T9SS type A sorting domain-containing protein [Sporocytophaga sp.]|uniref:PKD domain-containing protein n=1 Tax=Sporocytophaga sp. TaxID=2231183 RepID=UPI001B1A50FC|nr:malectin domain-containing carbohydrate-binding protein [Sporocytophaga sp.]MBO9700808.1 T9SS type A sorting domain-containing protein [Sporocytophaga sp.]